MKSTGASGIVYRSTILVFQYCKCTILVQPVLYMYDTGITSIVTLQYWYFQYCTVLQYWYYQYCNIYNTGNTSIVNITILVIPVSRPAASYYPIFLTYVSYKLKNSLLSKSRMDTISKCNCCYMIFLTYVSYKLRYDYSFACVHIQFICYFKTFFISKMKRYL